MRYFLLTASLILSLNAFGKTSIATDALNSGVADPIAAPVCKAQVDSDQKEAMYQVAIMAGNPQCGTNGTLAGDATCDPKKDTGTWTCWSWNACYLGWTTYNCSCTGLKAFNNTWFVKCTTP
jgi:hypothetical protein